MLECCLVCYTLMEKMPLYVDSRSFTIPQVFVYRLIWQPELKVFSICPVSGEDHVVSPYSNSVIILMESQSAGFFGRKIVGLLCVSLINNQFPLPAIPCVLTLILDIFLWKYFKIIINYYKRSSLPSSIGILNLALKTFISVIICTPFFDLLPGSFFNFDLVWYSFYFPPLLISAYLIRI